MNTTATLAFATLPDSVTGPVNTLGGYFMFLLNFFAIVAVTAVGVAIAYHHIKHRPMFGIEPGEWFFKAIVGLIVATAAADIAAVVILG